MKSRPIPKYPDWLIMSLAIGFGLCLPLLIPAALIVEALEKRRVRSAAKSFACLNCGRVLGVEAVKLADRAWHEHVRELMRQNPGVRFRLLRKLYAICPACDAHYNFRRGERTFVSEQPRATV